MDAGCGARVGSTSVMRVVFGMRGMIVPSKLSAEELVETVDHRIFWHCFEDEAMTGFGIFEDGKLASLAAVRAEDDRVWEIGIDTAPEAKGRGLGRAVTSAAGRWILENNRFVFASTAPWNVRSARTLRSVGLQFIMSVMIGMPGPFYAAPQPLGTPYSPVPRCITTIPTGLSIKRSSRRLGIDQLKGFRCAPLDRVWGCS